MYKNKMKVTKDTYNQIVQDFFTLFDRMTDPQRKDFNNWYYGKQRKMLVWSFWYKITDDKKQDINKEHRIFKYDPTFEMYPDNTNDKTLETAILAAMDQVTRTRNLKQGKKYKY